MDFKSYAVAIRDLFRRHCEENDYSAEQITQRVVNYYFEDEDEPEAQSLFNDLREDIQKLRYPPKSSRDMTFENKRPLIEWVAGYLDHDEFHKMECLKLLCLTADLAKSFPERASIENSLFAVIPDREELFAYVGFWGEMQKYNIPVNKNVKPVKEKLKGRAKGIGCEFTVPSELSAIDENVGDELYAIYKLRFFTSDFRTPEWSIFRQSFLDVPLEFVGINTSKQDRMFVFVDRFTKQTYMARNDINDKGLMVWEFMTTVTFFNDYFERKRIAKTKFPMLRPLIFPNMSTNYYDATMDGVSFDRFTFSVKDWLEKWFHELKKKFHSLMASRSSRGDVFQLLSDDDIDGFKQAIKNNEALINEVDRDGNTPLFIAVKYRKDEMIDFILECEIADLSHKNNHGDDVLSSARYLRCSTSKFLIRRVLLDGL